MPSMLGQKTGSQKKTEAMSEFRLRRVSGFVNVRVVRVE